jgi:hypothetical protein
MPLITTLRARVKADLQAVSGIGQVHDYERFSNDPSSFASFFVSAGLVNGWTVVVGMESAWASGHEVDRFYRVTIRGYRVVNDAAASAKSFDEEIDGVMTALENDWHLNHLVENLEGGIDATDPEYRVFGEALCHYIEIKARYRQSRVLA